MPLNIPKQEFVLRQFGLYGLRTAIYNKAVGTEQGTHGAEFPAQSIGELPQGASGGFPKQQGSTATRMNSGADDVPVISLLDTAVWCDVILADEKEVPDLKVQLMTVLVTVTQKKFIVTTNITGRRGSIKEYIADGDFEINMKGALVSAFPDVYPREEFQTLFKLFKKPLSIKIASPFLQQFGIYDIAVTDYSFPQQEGYQNMQLFDINALSDLPIELIDNG